MCFCSAEVNSLADEMVWTESGLQSWWLYEGVWGTCFCAGWLCCGADGEGGHGYSCEYDVFFFFFLFLDGILEDEELFAFCLWIQVVFGILPDRYDRIVSFGILKARKCLLEIEAMVRDWWKGCIILKCRDCKFVPL